MEHAVQVKLIHELFRHIDAGTVPLAEAITRNPVASYTSMTRFDQERRMLFRQCPLVVGYSSQLRNPGDYVTDELAEVPCLVVRGEASALHAFFNVCRHRGSQLASGCGSGKRRITCPYHGWTYDTAGRLIAIPDELGFDGLDRRQHNLIRLPVVERYGLVWVQPTPGGEMDIDAYLGGLGRDLAAYHLETYSHRETRVLRRRMNWKLISDTFWEAYHIKTLHTQTIAKLFYRNLAAFESFGSHHRLVAPRQSLESLRGLPETEWDLIPHATILNSLFPNTILIMQSDHVEVFRIYPAARINESACRVDLLTPDRPLPGAVDARWKKVMDQLITVTEEDFVIGEGIQRGFESRAQDSVTYGRYEQALAHFHASLREALAGR